MDEDALTYSLSLASIADRLADRAMWVTIGNDGHRVGTGAAIEFVQLFIGAAADAEHQPLIELQVRATEGHRTAPDAHARAAAWLQERMTEKQN